MPLSAVSRAARASMALALSRERYVCGGEAARRPSAFHRTAGTAALPGASVRPDLAGGLATLRRAQERCRRARGESARRCRGLHHAADAFGPLQTTVTGRADVPERPRRREGEGSGRLPAVTASLTRHATMRASRRDSLNDSGTPDAARGDPELPGLRSARTAVTFMEHDRVAAQARAEREQRLIKVAGADCGARDLPCMRLGRIRNEDSCWYGPRAHDPHRDPARRRDRPRDHGARASRCSKPSGEFEFEEHCSAAPRSTRTGRADRRDPRRLHGRRRGAAGRRRRPEVGHDRPGQAAPRAGPARAAQGAGPVRQPAARSSPLPALYDAEPAEAGA